MFKIVNEPARPPIIKNLFEIKTKYNEIEGIFIYYEKSKPIISVYPKNYKRYTHVDFEYQKGFPLNNLLKGNERYSIKNFHNDIFISIFPNNVNYLKYIFHIIYICYFTFILYIAFYY